MGKSEAYLRALDKGHMFENQEHRTRFKELIDCFGNYPFFSKGLCKCIYLSAWDEEHFAIMLEMLNDMVLGREKNTDDMRSHGEVLAEEQKDGEYYIYELSCAYLAGRKFLPSEYEKADEPYRYIISRSLEASDLIDQVQENDYDNEPDL